MRFPLISKMGALGAVTLGLLWSLWSVQSVVHERQGRQREAGGGEQSQKRLHMHDRLPSHFPNCRHSSNCCRKRRARCSGGVMSAT